MMTYRLTRWDPVLLRKFSSTGHFRLLNQLKGDLRKNPLDRDRRTGHLKSLGGNRGATRRSSLSRISESAQAPVVETMTPLNKDDQPKSFRDRLSAIDMR